MNRNQLKKLQTWFDEYVGGFYGSDEVINANIQLKDKHSRQTCGQMKYLANQLKLDENKTAIAHAIALLHDTGRFEQFVKYRTYSDCRSVNHALLGLEIIQRFNLLNNIDTRERQLIETAIKYHGDKDLPAELTGDNLVFSQLIRDADKLDIYRVVIEYYKLYLSDPENFKLEIELPDEPYYSQPVLESVLTGKKFEYSRLKTLNDMKLLQLGWVYDVNFAATLLRIKQLRYIESILTFLPDTADIRLAGKKVLEYIDRRIETSR